VCGATGAMENFDVLEHNDEIVGGGGARLLNETGRLFAHLYTPNIALNTDARLSVKLAAFELVNKIHTQTYNCTIDDRLAYREPLDEIVISKTNCSHGLILNLNRLAKVMVLIVNSPEFQASVYAFSPFCKQLKHINKLFIKDYCCQDLVKETDAQLNAVIAKIKQCHAIIKVINERLQIINIFDDDIKLYQCNICKETSLDSNFIRPNKCCGYEMCYVCYANMWQHCTLYPVCPVCKTSFKSASQISKKLSDSD
jgi:predicted DNA-binding protein YlxM (UPF0122 family)